MNCSEKDCYLFSFLETTCSTAPFSLAVVALFLCLVAIPVYVSHCRRLNVVSQGHVHLISLTISDFLIALPCLIARWWVRSLSLAGRLNPAFQTYFNVWYFTYSLPFFGNRWLTLYIGQRRLHAVRDAYFRASERGRSVVSHSVRALFMGYLPGVLVASTIESTRLGLGFSGWLTESRTESVYAGIAAVTVTATTVTSAILAYKTVHVILSWRFNEARVAKETKDGAAPTETNDNGESKIDGAFPPSRVITFGSNVSSNFPIMLVEIVFRCAVASL